MPAAAARPRRAAPYDPGYATTGYNEGLHNNYGRYFNFNARYTF